jgi:dihydroneopterin aldolase
VLQKILPDLPATQQVKISANKEQAVISSSTQHVYTRTSASGSRSDTW